MLVVIGGVILGAGAVIVWARWVAADRGSSFARSWLAISLVLGLLLFTGLAFALGATNTLSLLIGALTATAGTAIAHYFASKAAAESRKDMLTAATGTEVVPDLTGMSEDAAVKAVARSPFRFAVDPATSPTNKTVGKQHPEPGTAAPRGSEVVATFQ